MNLLRQQRTKEAIEQFETALAENRAVWGDRHTRTAQNLSNLAMARFALGEPAAAQKLFEEAVSIFSESVGDYQAATAVCRFNLAFQLVAEGDFGGAVRLLDQSAAGFESARLAIADRGFERATFGETSSPYWLLAAAHANMRSPRDAWQAMELDLARGLAEESARGRRVAVSPDEQSARDELASQLESLQNKIAAQVGAEPAESQSELTADLLKQRRTAESRLAELAVAESRRAVAPLAEIQSSLREDAALIFWVDVTGSSSGCQEHWGCVVRHAGDPHWERLKGSGPNSAWTADDDDLPTGLFESLASGGQSSAAVESSATRLREQRLAPLVPHLSGVRTLLVIPVGVMAGVPVELLARDHVVSYAPSGTFLVRAAARSRSPNTRLLALGAPSFGPRRATAPPDSLPMGGLLIVLVEPDSAAANAGLERGDVLLRYGDVDLNAPDDLSKAIQSWKGSDTVPISVWRAGVEKPLAPRVRSGVLGVQIAQEPAAEAIVAEQRAEVALQTLRGGDWTDLPGARAEVSQIAGLFEPDTVSRLIGPDASEAALDAMRSKGELRSFRFLHFATHGLADVRRAFESELILSQNDLPDPPLPRKGEPMIDGRLSAREILEFWTIDAELVTVSACETGIGRKGGGDGVLGFAQAFLTAGSRAVCVSLWKVDDAASALLMTRFYQNLLGRRAGLEAPLGKAAALDEAKRWLKELRGEEARALIAAADAHVGRGKEERLKVPPPESGSATADGERPFSHPRHWSAFVLIGDPN